MQPDTKPAESDIRDRAFHLWEVRGRPEGYEEEFWLQAERELLGEASDRPVPHGGDHMASGSGSDCNH